MFSTRVREQELELENNNAFSCHEAAREKTAANVKPVTNWRTAFAMPDAAPTVTITGGRIELHGQTRTDWLARFDGDGESLELALVQAAGYVQPNNLSKSLDVQVAAQLARIANDHRQRRKNLASIKSATAPPKSKIPVHMQRY